MTLTSLAVVLAVLAGTGQRDIGADARLHGSFQSKFLSTPRDIVVWLPPGYATEKDRRYPVLYMHDGQNVYIEWRIDEIAKPLIAAKEIEPLIIVMVGNGPRREDRFEDYTWTKSPNIRFGGNADAYERMLIEEVKPLIDKTYRTLPDAANTALGGASLGGIVTLHFGLKYPDVFGKLVVMSPSVWWDNRLIIRDVDRVKVRPATRIWLDVGEKEGNQTRRDAQSLRDALVRKGWRLGADLVYFELPDGKHTEEWFAKRAPDFLKFLFPAK